jgi:alkaline phosphatase
MQKAVLLLFALSLPLSAQRAKNVVLFLGDAGGVATLNAASILGHDDVQKLYIQSMPNVGLSDTSTASNWVTDSAAGMTAIVTGVKTHNGVISQGPDAVRGQKDGAPLKTILEYAEEHGLSTGVLSNMTMTDATPAATYAHANDRGDFARIFRDLLKPRFGDGVDVLIGPGRSAIDKKLVADGSSIAELMKGADRPLYDSLDAIPSDTRRAIALFETRKDFSLPQAVDRAISILSKNPKGFFLMVEGDMHTDDVEAGLRRALELDDIIRSTAKRLRNEKTLILFTADHSFDLRLRGGKRGAGLLEGDEPSAKQEKAYRGKAVRMEGSHTGEEVVVAAEGPGADRVHGFMPNTRIFHIMMQAYGWEKKGGNASGGQ